MKPIIVANWKMNPTDSRQAFSLYKEVQKGTSKLKAELVLCPPFVYIPQLLASKNMKVGAQNCSFEQSGALTGEISPKQLKNLGCTHVIIGHSERKKYLAETLGMVAAKVKAAKKVGLIPVLCVESTSELLMLKKSIGSLKNIVLAFEPSSAISTQGGKLVTPSGIARVAKEMRKAAGKGVPVLYGGSVGAKNVRAVLEQGGVEGVLAGAASLKAKEFIRLVKEAVLA